AEIEQPRLQVREDAQELLVERALRIARRRGQADAGVEFIHRAERGDARVVLRDALRPEEPGGAVIARARVELHRRPSYSVAVVRVILPRPGLVRLVADHVAAHRADARADGSAL